MDMLVFVCDDLNTEVLSERGGEMWSEKEPLTVQQGMLKSALLDSEGLDYAVWDGRGDDRNGFLDWIVRQAEHRVAPGRDVAGESAASVDGSCTRSVTTPTTVTESEMVRKLSSVGLDTSTPLSWRQAEFKKAFVNSEVAQ